MRGIRKVIVAAGVAVVAAALAQTGRADRSTGDRCTAIGGGLSFTLSFTIPRGAPLQEGLAVGTPGGQIYHLLIPDASGTVSEGALPNGTSSGWMFDPAAPTGTITIQLEMDNSVSARTFTVVPLSSERGVSFAPVSCPVAAGGGQSNAFSASAVPSYDAATRSWDEAVSVPGGGFVQAYEVYTKGGGPLVVKAGSAPPLELVRAGSAYPTRAGRVELQLTPTSAGSAAVSAHGSLTIFLSVSFHPSAGAPSTRVLTLTLRR